MSWRLAHGGARAAEGADGSGVGAGTKPPSATLCRDPADGRDQRPDVDVAGVRRFATASRLATAASEEVNRHSVWFPDLLPRRLTQREAPPPDRRRRTPPRAASTKPPPPSESRSAPAATTTTWWAAPPPPPCLGSSHNRSPLRQRSPRHRPWRPRRAPSGRGRAVAGGTGLPQMESMERPRRGRPPAPLALVVRPAVGQRQGAQRWACR